MNRLRLIVGACSLLVASCATEASAAAAQARGIFFRNGTGVALTGFVMRSYNREPWRPVGGGAAAANQRITITPTPGECAYDVRAALPDGKSVTWAGVNLCDTATITLNRRPDGATWVDYD